MPAYYNEFDPKVAAWLRQLIKNGDIADGEVDERCITQVKARDLRGFTQHHFFAGVGVWSFALKNAGWSDSTPVCTASLPCQPFSAAGKGLGKQDERHLLPHFINLVSECRFDTIIGEQVPRAIQYGWLDDLYDEMEQQGYACGSSVLTAAGAGSPHIRQRIYWTAIRLVNTSSQGLQGQRQFEQINDSERWKNQKRHHSETSLVGGMPNSNSKYGRFEQQFVSSKREGEWYEFERSGELNWMGDTDSERLNGQPVSIWEGKNKNSEINGAGESIDWLYCKDNKYRPIKSGITPLVNGAARGMGHSSDSSISPNETSEARVMRIKGYGNAIQAKTAELFIRALMSTQPKS